jgi:hypothetical protein
MARESSTELAHADAVIDQQSGSPLKQVDNGQSCFSIREM